MLDIQRTLLCATFALTVAGCAGSPTRESTGEYVDDVVLTTKVDTKLIRSGFNPTRIKVETFKGKVQLSGFVKSEQEKQTAAQLAESVDGVKEVINEILVD